MSEIMVLNIAILALFAVIAFVWMLRVLFPAVGVRSNIYVADTVRNDLGHPLEADRYIDTYVHAGGKVFPGRITYSQLDVILQRGEDQADEIAPRLRWWQVWRKPV